jgi:HSP20 family protein
MLTRYDRYNPFREMRRMMAMMDNLMERSLLSDEDDEGISPLALDVTTNEQSVIVRTAIPGVKEDDIHIEVRGDMLTISGESKSEVEDKQENYHRREMRYGKFSRSVRLPEEVHIDKAEAELDNGILTITLPRSEPSKMQQIAVKARNLIGSGKKS